MGARTADTGALTTILLVIIAIAALLTIVAIVRGAQLKRQRAAADRIETDRLSAATSTAAPPVAPPPPPLDPIPVVPEPIAAAPGPDPAAAPTLSLADGPVTQLKGLGPKVTARLAELGVTTVGQIAALDAAEAEALDARLGAFAGRMDRDRWIEQARFLAAGDRAGFEAVFGKL